MGLQSKQKKSMELALLILVYGLCITLVSAFWPDPVKLTGCYVVVIIITLLKWHTKADLVAFAAGAILGPLGEVVGVHYGAWTYAQTNLVIPMWVPLLWGIAGFFIGRLTWTITSMLPNRE